MPSFRALLNRWRRRLVRLLLHRQVFGEANAVGDDRPHTRISPSTCIEHEERLVLGDHVYIGPFNVLEASAGIVLEDGVQITSHCSVVTHSSHRAMRLMGRTYVQAEGAGLKARPGWISGPVHIGAFSFIGPHSLIEAGTRLGRGTLVCAGSVVRGAFPDFAVLRGNPAQVVGDTRQTDEALLQAFPAYREHYEAWAGAGFHSGDGPGPANAEGAPLREARR